MLSIPASWVFWLVSCAIGLLVARIVYLFSNILDGRKNGPHITKAEKKSIKTMVVAGSGGHTGEMLRVVSVLRPAYSPRVYLVAQTDQMSDSKIHSMETSKTDTDTQYVVHHIPRSREVRQSWSSSVLSTMYSCLYTFPLVWKERPDLLLVNGPGTCIPVCVAAFILKFFGVRNVRIVFIESLCRVKTLSLSGKLLYFFADQFVVQWPDLKEKYRHVQYMGRVV